MKIYLITQGWSLKSAFFCSFNNPQHSVLLFSAASSCTLFLGSPTFGPGLFWSLHCVGQLKSELSLIFQGVDFYSCPRGAFSSSRGRLVVSGRRELSGLVLKLSSELCVTWSFSLGFLFLSWEDNVALHQPLLIQLIISWAARVTTSLPSYSLFFTLYLQSDVQSQAALAFIGSDRKQEKRYLFWVYTHLFLSIVMSTR